ncbi:MAG: hypothetical protein LUE27_08430 [Clostridia bacterium]|nr:hypothetical protein [Clostridia bacterium]
MGRGHGGYVEKNNLYRDTANHKVKDNGAICVGESYIEAGYCVVFIKQQSKENNVKKYDLAIKDYDDTEILDRIEVKQVTSTSPSRISDDIEKGGAKFTGGYTGSVDLYFPRLKNNQADLRIVQAGIDYALRENNRKSEPFIKGSIRVWLSDGTHKDYLMGTSKLLKV